MGKDLPGFLEKQDADLKRIRDFSGFKPIG
jgi:hypothetical protein